MMTEYSSRNLVREARLAIREKAKEVGPTRYLGYILKVGEGHVALIAQGERKANGERLTVAIAI